ncbi:unnamed protein product [Allacma fusca]|uniref:Peptidase S1 domain-containing protein n=1 Tax=Allacma fusca TaxID=39272 RepID=A0A8J2PVW8_9HEXA|nr:unnamed protein product [Allacma fusca]
MFLGNTLAAVSLLLFVAGSPMVRNPGEERVQLGDEPVENYPSLVSVGLSFKDGVGSLCGGTLITERHVLTAAHCYTMGKKYKNFRAVFGSRHKMLPPNNDSDVILFGLKAWTVNPLYKGPADGHHYDTAVITLPRKVKMSNSIKTIRLASQEYTDNVRVVGWGQNDCNGGAPDNYLYAKGWVVDEDTCAESWGEPTHESQICAKFENENGDPSGNDAGDSGGPLYATADDGEDVQIGSVSISKKRKAPKECTDVSSPMKYAKMSEEQGFIQSVAPDAEFI